MEAIIGIGICVFMILPVSAYLLDKCLVLIKAGIIRDSIDMANLSLYDSMKMEDISSCTIGFDQEALMAIYKSILAENLKLDEDLNPLKGSLSDGPVYIRSIAIYLSGFPCSCPNGTVLKRPAVHSVVSVAFKPSLFSGLISDLTGLSLIDCPIHTDTELPVDN